MQAETWVARKTVPITQFDIPNSELDKLDIKKFSSADLEWGDFVTKGRKGTLNHNHDSVSGPMLANPSDAKRGKAHKAIGLHFVILQKKAFNLFNQFKKVNQTGKNCS